MTRRRTVLLNTALAGALVLTAGGTWLALRPSSASAASGGGTVRTATASVGTVAATISAQGNVAAVRVADPAFSVSGTVRSVRVAVGDTVKKGELLATLETGDLADAVDAAQDALGSAQAQLTTASLQRTSADQSVAEARAAYAETTTTTDPQTGETTTSRKGTLSQITNAQAQRSQANAQVTSAAQAVTRADADLADAKAALAEARLVAPMAGVVTAVNTAVGSSVSAGGSGSSGASGAASATASTATTSSGGVVTIQDPKRLELDASFAEADTAQLSVGQTASVTFPAVPDASAAATVTAIAPTGTATNGVVTYGATIRLTTVPAGVRLGQTANVTVTTAEAVDVVNVPSNAVTVGATTGGVTAGTVTLVAADGTQTVTDVVIGVQGDSATEITSGVAEGDTVLVSLDTAIGTTTSTTQQDGGFGGPPAGFGGTFGGRG